jgi:hypothetical protein
MAWLDSQDPKELWTCTIVVAEVFSGLDLMPDGKRQQQFREKAEHMFSALFADLIWAFDETAAGLMGRSLGPERRWAVQSTKWMP